MDYYTVTFYDGTIELTTPAQQIVLKNMAASAPTDNPTKTGYTFSKWLTTEGGDTEYTFTEKVTGKTSAYASWTPVSYKIEYDLDGGTATGNPTSYTIESSAITLKKPSKEGYRFAGWSGTDLTGSSNMSVTIATGSTGERKYTAHWTAADYKVTLHTNGGTGGTDLTAYTYGTGAVLPADWTKTGYTFAGWYDNENFTGTAVTNISGTDIGNKEYWAKWTDDIAPVIGTLTYNYQPANLWNWLIGKDSLIITVPVTEEGSGADIITYTVTPDGGAAKVETAAIKNGEAEITVSADFKGTISIVCTDRAGNTSAGVTVGAGLGANGIIIEDNAPDITTDVRTDYYDTAAAINVTVKDDTGNAITAGIASVTYQAGDGTAKPVTIDTNALQAEITFTIPASEIPTGVTEITVTATDNAGNEVTKRFIVKVKGPEKKPAAVIGYREEKLKNLVPGEKYAIDGTEYTADGEGCIPITEGWFDSTVSIIKKGNGSETTDSPAQSLFIPARPAAPGAPELSVRDDKSITLKTITGAQYRLADGTGNWQDSTAFTGLVQKTIYTFKAHYPATDLSFASLESDEARIATMPTAPTKDKLKIGYIAESLTLTDGIEAFTDLSCTTPVTAGSVTAYMGQTLYIRYPADGMIPASLTTAVPILARPAKPAPGAADASYPTATDGAITGLTSGTAYEYRVKDENGNFGPWKDAVLNGTRIENLPAGEYEVRVRAVETGNVSFHSEAAAVTIGEKPGVKVTFMANGEEYAIRFTKNGGTLTDIPPVPPKKDAGDQTYTREWCSDEQGTLAVFTNITADMTVYAVYTTTYTITLQSGTGYTLSAETGSVSPVKEGGSFTFRFALRKGYQKTGRFAVKVNGVKVEPAADGTYAITDIRENQIVTVEGVVKTQQKPKPEDPKPEDPKPEPDDLKPNPDDLPPTPPVNPPAKTVPSGPPGTIPPADNEPEGRKPGSTPRQEENVEPGEPEEKPGTDSEGAGTPKADRTDAQAAESADGTPAEKTEVKIGNGIVIVTVVCEEEKCTATVADTEAVANAVLSSEQQELVNSGETIEIRIDVTDISDQVPARDKEVIESGIKAHREEVQGLVLGMYVDISMFVRIGTGDWNAITVTNDPVEVVIRIPDKLLSDGREYYIVRAHNGECAFMTDLDDVPDTITISTNMFSSYAIAYVETDETETDDGAECGLCHICPTFLGICCFIWLAVLAVIFIVIFMALRRRKKEEPDRQ